MSIIHLNHIESNCKSRFSGLIDMSDVTGKNEVDTEAHFLTRAVAAFALAELAKIEDVEAALTVTDEFRDDGIDAFYFDKKSHICYLAQSKYSKNGSGSIDVGSVLKFIQGVNHLLEAKFDQLGPKLKAKSADIQDALDDSQARFVLVLAYTGRSGLSVEVEEPIESLLFELNDDGNWVSLQVLRQAELHSIVEQRSLGESVDLTVMLHEFGKVSEPYTAYYGQVVVADLTDWAKYGDHLYYKNIRGFKGSTDVNDLIAATLKDNPDHFLYFNNGITLLCSQLEKRPLGGKLKTTGVFECKGASVVNGAQTVGSILTALKSSGDTLGSARVMVRLISLESCPPEFGLEVTKATNTQNRIEKKDFAALDKEQARLRSEMALSLQKEYAYKTGDATPAPEKGCTLDEAAVALACAFGDVGYSVLAKREVGRLYDDITQPPYTALFNNSLSAVTLWKSIEVLRGVDAYLQVKQSETEGKNRLIAIHGNRLVLHLVFSALGSLVGDGNLEEEKVVDVSSIASSALARLTEEFLTNYSSSYPANLFKNVTKCRTIAKDVKAKLLPQDPDEWVIQTSLPLLLN
jgi:hypothetical protein